MNAILETERILLREFLPEDAPFLYELNADPEVLKYTGDVRFENPEAAAHFISNYNDYALHGMGRWACIQKSSSAFLGWCGLKRHVKSNEVDVGFRLLKKQWGRGFATEAAQSCLHYGFGYLQVEEIIGRAQKDNVASIRVLEKLGMKFNGNFEFDLHPGVKYKLGKIEFFQQQKTRRD